MTARPARVTLLTFIIAARLAPLAVAQTTVVQAPGSGGGGGTTTVMIQSDGNGNTVVLTQGAAGAAGGPQGPGAGAIVGGVAGGVVGGVADGGLGPLPPRDQQTAPVVGNSVIRGRVVAADTGRPLRRATVRLSAAGVREQRSASTDQDGRYEFSQLPAAQYTLLASKGGYVQMGYKQVRPNTTQRPLTIGERETAEHIDIALPSAGVITGRVVDEFGEAVSDVFVSAQRQQYVNGARRPMTTGAPASTNDIGEFRLYGLAPGDYYVSAAPRAQGNPFDVSADRTGYGQTYYPSAVDAASAQRVSVRSGDTVSNIVIALTPTRMTRVSGTVLDAEGRPARAGAVMAMPRDAMGPPTGNATVRPDGSFTFSGLPPGDYTLRSLPGGPGASATMAAATVSVNGTDLSNITLVPQVPLTISGRLTGDPAVLARIRPAAVRMVVAPAGLAVFGGPLPPPPPLRDDLSFELSTYPGSVLLRATGLADAAIRAVRLNGRDVTKGFDAQTGTALTDIEVELSAASARVDVAVLNARDQPIADRDIVVFPQDDSRWGVQIPGHAAVGRTDEQGHYQTPQLLAGAYYVTDADALEPGQANDPEFLESLRSRAQRVSLGDAETANVRIRVSER